MNWVVYWTVVAVLVVLAGIHDVRKRKAHVESRGWRLRNVKGGFAYEQKEDGAWREVKFDWVDERDAPGVAIIPDNFPAWAASRREEILSRIRSELVSPTFKLVKMPNQPPEPTR